jgi:hypothetical protein
MGSASMRLLITFLAAPTIWVIHLMLSYLLVALHCESDWSGGRVAVVLTTLICAAAALGAGAFAWYEWKRVREPVASGQPLDPGRTPGFLTLSGALLSILFAAAIVLAGMSPLFLPMCG